MTPEEQRIIIAQACGWRQVGFGAREGLWRHSRCRTSILAKQLPDYLNDLNAMHEAEKMLTAKQRDVYAAKIADVTGCDDMLFGFIHSTAAQRCEAFLRTLNKWKD